MTMFFSPSATINFREAQGPWKPLPGPGQNVSRPSLVVIADVQEYISESSQKDIIPQHSLTSGSFFLPPLVYKNVRLVLERCLSVRSTSCKSMRI